MIKRFFVLLLFVFAVLIIPKGGVRALRSLVASGFSFASRIQGVSNRETHEESKLELENQMLRGQLQRFVEWVSNERALEKEWETFIALTEQSDDPFFKRRADALCQILHRHLRALPAKVIYREPGTWSSTIWINVGQIDNQAINAEVVAENSPVVIGRCVVGVIETVEEKRSKVRLLTDPALTPSVRVVRGSGQNQQLHSHLTQVIDLLQGREDLYGAKEIVKALATFCGQLDQGVKESYLAKGTLHGSKTPLRRLHGQTLVGSGFNYDVPDAEGEARILRTGETQSGREKAPLIRKGDLLVTTGLDGVFPPDLHVAVVTKILPLREGGTAYSLEAKPLAPNFDTLSEVFVFPPPG